MKVLLLSFLALGSAATAATFGHESAPRHSWQQFPLTLDAASLGPAGVVDASSERCVSVRAEGAAYVLGGHATLAATDPRAPGATRLRLDAAPPRGGATNAAGALPLTIELDHFDMRGSGDALVVGAALPQGALALAVQQRLTLTLVLEHVGAPLRFTPGAC